MLLETSLLDYHPITCLPCLWYRNMCGSVLCILCDTLYTWQEEYQSDDIVNVTVQTTVKLDDC